MNCFLKRKIILFAAAAVLLNGGCTVRNAVCPSACSQLEREQAKLLEAQRKHLKVQSKLAAEELKTARIENRRLEKKYRKTLEE